MRVERVRRKSVGYSPGKWAIFRWISLFQKRERVVVYAHVVHYSDGEIVDPDRAKRGRPLETEISPSEISPLRPLTTRSLTERASERSMFGQTAVTASRVSRSLVLLDVVYIRVPTVTVEGKFSCTVKTYGVSDIVIDAVALPVEGNLFRGKNWHIASDIFGSVQNCKYKGPTCMPEVFINRLFRSVTELLSTMLL